MQNTCTHAAHMSPAFYQKFCATCGNMTKIRNKILFDFYPGLPQMYYDICATLLYSTVSQVIRHPCCLSLPTGIHFQVVSKQHEHRLLLMERPQSDKKVWSGSLCMHYTFSEGLMWKLRDLSTSGRSTEQRKETSSSTISPLSGHAGGGFSCGGRVSKGASDSKLLYPMIRSAEII